MNQDQYTLLLLEINHVLNDFIYLQYFHCFWIMSGTMRVFSFHTTEEILSFSLLTLTAGRFLWTSQTSRAVAAVEMGGSGVWLSVLVFTFRHNNHLPFFLYICQGHLLEQLFTVSRLKLSCVIRVVVLFRLRKDPLCLETQRFSGVLACKFDTQQTVLQKRSRPSCISKGLQIARFISLTSRWLQLCFTGRLCDFSYMLVVAFACFSVQWHISLYSRACNIHKVDDACFKTYCANIYEKLIWWRVITDLQLCVMAIK